MLILDGHADTSIQSLHGYDALHIAVQSRCTNITFILLELGANPDAIDHGGNTPFHWLVKHYSGESLDFQRILLNYKASALIPDNNGNSPLHTIASAQHRADLHSAFIVYEAGWPSLPSTKNKLGQFPSQLCKESEMMTRFLSDAYAYMKYPRWIPTVASAAVVVLVFVLAYIFGWLYSLAALPIVYLIWDRLVQTTIMRGHSRQMNGFAWGIIITIVGSFFLFYSDKVSSKWTFFAVFISIIISISLYLSAVIQPVNARDLPAASTTRFCPTTTILVFLFILLDRNCWKA